MFSNANKMGLKRVVVLMMGCLGFSRQPTPTQPSENGESPATVDLPACDLDPPSRIKLSDGRALAYTERGVPKNMSSYMVILVHGFASSKEMNFMASQDILAELKIYLLLYDRAGYGDSDPNPKRSLKTEASDIEELADKLQLGSKFYVLGVSLGCYPVWGCLREIPNRLAGIALVVPYVNYTWPSLPNDLTKNDYRKGLSRLTVFVASCAPGLLHWLTQKKLFPSTTVLDRNSRFFSRKDLEVLKNTPGYQVLSQNKISDRIMFDSLLRDLIVAYGKWDFDPMDICDPYPECQSTVHIWQGRDDKVVPIQLQRHVSRKLPWIRYHEVPDGGHLLIYDSAVCEAILRSLLLGEDPPMYSPEYAD